MEWVTTSLLLEQLRDFDNEVAWNKLVEFFRAPLAAFARRMGLVDNDADDLVQETLIAFASAYCEGKYDPEKGRLSDWLFGISYRQIQNARRKSARHDAPLVRRSEDSFSFDELPGREEATRTWNEEWAKSLLANCLQRVRVEVEPNTYRAFELTVFSKRKAAEVADELGMTSNAVFLAKHRIVRRIRELQASFESLN